MAQVFKIRQNSELPTLRMTLVNDGKYDFLKRSVFNNAIQNALVTFSMRDERGVLKISKAKANIVLEDMGDCGEIYLIEYAWKKKDTKTKGIFSAWFEIEFGDDIYQENTEFPSGTLVMPLQEELMIQIL